MKSTKKLCDYNIGVNCSDNPKHCKNCGWYESGIKPGDPIPKKWFKYTANVRNNSSKIMEEDFDD